MAFYKIVERKNGVVYKIIASYKDATRGVAAQKSKTWKPEIGMSKKEIEKELNALCIAWDEEVKDWASQNQDLSTYDKANMTFIKYLNNVWLPENYDRFSPSYRKKAVDGAKKLSKYSFANEKMKDINSKKVKSLFNELKREKKITISIKVVKNVAEVFRQYGFGYTEIRDKYHINIEAIYRAARGLKNLSPKIANEICEKTNIPFDKLFIEDKIIEEYADETINGTMKIVKQVLQFASSGDVIKCNYASAEKVGRFLRKNNINNEDSEGDGIVTLEADDARKLFDRCMIEKDYRKGIAVSILLLTGLRNGELCGLKWKDIDFEKSVLKVRRTTQRVSISSLTEEEKKNVPYINKDKSTVIIVKNPKTDKSKRTMTMGEVLTNILKKYREDWDQARAILGDRVIYDEGFLFMQENGAPIEHRTITSWLNQFLQELNIKHVRVHDLRHTNITILIDQAVPITTVSSRAGHSRRSTTLDIYAGSLKTADESAAQAVDNFFNGKVDEEKKEVIEIDTKPEINEEDEFALLRKYKKLLDEGIIEKEDFDALKKKILGI